MEIKFGYEIWHDGRKVGELDPGAFTSVTERQAFIDDFHTIHDAMDLPVRYGGNAASLKDLGTYLDKDAVDKAVEEAKTAYAKEVYNGVAAYLSDWLQNFINRRTHASDNFRDPVHQEALYDEQYLTNEAALEFFYEDGATIDDLKASPVSQERRRDVLRALETVKYYMDDTVLAEDFMLGLYDEIESGTYKFSDGKSDTPVNRVLKRVKPGHYGYGEFSIIRASSASWVALWNGSEVFRAKTLTKLQHVITDKSPNLYKG